MPAKAGFPMKKEPHQALFRETPMPAKAASTIKKSPNQALFQETLMPAKAASTMKKSPIQVLLHKRGCQSEECTIMRILVVEDDPSLHKIISRRLREEGYAVDDCYNGEEALSYLLAAEYDCVILDWMLPVRDGIAVLSEARQRGITAPVLMLTAKDAISDRVQGLDAGADDYLTKPFAYDELSARVRALLRRKAKEKQTMLTAGDLVMDLAAHRVTRGEKEITLTSKEFALLEYLLRNQGLVLTRSQIADHVWNYDFDYDSNVVDVYIRYLRNKIDKPFGSSMIQTVRGYGYTLKAE